MEKTVTLRVEITARVPVDTEVDKLTVEFPVAPRFNTSQPDGPVSEIAAKYMCHETTAVTDYGLHHPDDLELARKITHKPPQS